MKISKLIILFIFILSLNIIWEFSHYRLYIDLTGIPPTLHLIIASFTDLLLISLIFLINSFYKKDINWIEKPKKSDYTLIVISGIIIAIIIEIYSTTNKRWAYTEAMPVIFGVGLSPLIQLFTTAIISLLLIKIIK